MNELPEPVTLASGVPEPHWAETKEESAINAATIENFAIVANIESEN